ncbi:hypothetical protein EK904_005931 [Melospiza melodia maxima]|nr:hypothetical protein EK904_005931 [Melospiza melodia maxima]
MSLQSKEDTSNLSGSVRDSFATSSWLPGAIFAFSNEGSFVLLLLPFPLGQKRPSDSNSGTLAKKQKRTPKRTSAAAKNEKNGTGQSSDSEDLPVLDSSSKCTPVKHINASKPQKISRSPARVVSPHIKDGEKDKHRDKHHHQNASPRVYKWSFQLNELDNMSSTERISFLQEKLQEIRKYYMSLKSEVATIDRRRKRLKKKDREVSHTGASMSSASSDTGMSPSSSSPPQNVLAVECRGSHAEMATRITQDGFDVELGGETESKDCQLLVFGLMRFCSGILAGFWLRAGWFCFSSAAVCIG